MELLKNYKWRNTKKCNSIKMTSSAFWVIFLTFPYENVREGGIINCYVGEEEGGAHSHQTRWIHWPSRRNKRKNFSERKQENSVGIEQGETPGRKKKDTLKKRAGESPQEKSRRIFSRKEQKNPLKERAEESTQGKSKRILSR